MNVTLIVQLLLLLLYLHTDNLRVEFVIFDVFTFLAGVVRMRYLCKGKFNFLKLDR